MAINRHSKAVPVVIICLVLCYYSFILHSNYATITIPQAHYTITVSTPTHPCPITTTTTQPITPPFPACPSINGFIHQALEDLSVLENSSSGGSETTKEGVRRLNATLGLYDTMLKACRVAISTTPSSSSGMTLCVPTPASLFYSLLVTHSSHPLVSLLLLERLQRLLYYHHHHSFYPRCNLHRHT